MKETGWLIGADTHHSRTDSERWAGQFHIFKATEGSTFIDPKFKEMLAEWNKIKTYPYPIGLYHFLSTKSKIVEQIDFYLDTIKDMKGKTLLILDYEGNFAKEDSKGLMLKDAINLLDYRTGGAQIMIYMDKSNAAKITEKTEIQALRNVCLWIADYNNSYNGSWIPVMRQVCSVPFDIDIFYGTIGSWDSMARTWR